MATSRDATTVAIADAGAAWWMILHDPAAALSAADKKVRADGFAKSDGSNGLVTWSGRTLTVPATGTAALLETANTFTSAQAIDTTSIIAFQILYGSVQRMNFTFTATLNQFQFQPIDFGTAVGSRIILGRNSNASTPAAGHLRMENLSGASYRFWPDASGNLRIHTSDPTNANDTAGTVVGTQTSMAAAKNLTDDITPIGDVLLSIQAAAAAAVRRFTYKSGSFNGQDFEGVVTDLAPRYGMDRDDAHPAGKSLNEVTLLGDLVRAVAYLIERVDRMTP